MITFGSHSLASIRKDLFAVQVIVPKAEILVGAVKPFRLLMRLAEDKIGKII
jgi:hypothetical protein